MEWPFLMTWVCVIRSSVAASAHFQLVHLKQGPVKGYKAPDGDFFVFYGIPYATAPTGKDRFKAPLPPPVWLDPLEAVDNGIICPQKDFLNILPKDRKKHENCLIATIYVPDTIENNIPVVVYVHGGAYLFGFGDYMTPRNFAKTKRVIIVTFNYRLGAHGFLCLGTTDIPGNAGMKDQIELLRWVRKNIASFGGNPEDVTIAGYSAGSASVDTIMLSKMAKGLFSKVIPESGVSLSTFNIQLNPLENAKRYAKWLNFTDLDDLHALEEFYKTVSFEILTSVYSLNLPDSTIIFSPCIEHDVGVERFLDDSPYNILTRGDYEKVPILYGFTTMEGLYRINMFDKWKNHMNKKFSDFLPDDLKFPNQKVKEKVAEKVKHFYFRKKIEPKTILGFVDYFSDVLINYSTLRSLKLLVESGNDKIYFYEYVHVDESTIKIPHTKVLGPDHCAQSWGVLDGLNLTFTNELLISASLSEMKNITRELWLNFIISGNPTPKGSSFPKWPPTGANGIPHMALDNKLEVRYYFERNLEQRYRLWDELYKKYYRMPIPPQPSLPTRRPSPVKLSSGSNTLSISSTAISLPLATFITFYLIMEYIDLRSD